MKTWSLKTRALSVLLGAAFITALPAHAQSWSIGIDGGGADLSDRAGGVDARHAAGLTLGYSFAPEWTIEVKHVRSDDRGGDRTLNSAYRSTGVGVRYTTALDGPWFVTARAGLAYGGYPVTFLAVTYDPDTNVYGGTVARYDNRGVGPYAGVGVGVNWSPRWNSTLEYNRQRGGFGVGCGVVDSTGGSKVRCDTGRDSDFTTVSMSLNYRF